MVATRPTTMTPTAMPQQPARTVRRGRLVLLAGGGFALLIGAGTGLVRAGVHEPFGPIAAHGVVMTLGFLGTLIALERAVALGGRWPYAAPALSSAAVIGLVAGLTTVAAGVLLTLAGVLVTIVYVQLLTRRVEPYLAIMASGAVAWSAAALLWTLGWSPVRITPLLAAFLVLTIVGERVELSRLRSPSPASMRRLTAAVVCFTLGVAASLVHRPVGLVVAGAGLLAQAAWLWRNDIARVTVRRTGLPRFVAVCLLAGHVWLAVAGGLWVALGLDVGGWLIHDAALHALFLGFTMSMVMGHAPIILPAVLGVSLPLRSSAWVPVALLHLSVTVRIAADLAGSVWLRGWAAYGNVTALLLFVAVAAWTVHRSTPSRRGTASAEALNVGAG